MESFLQNKKIMDTPNVQKHPCRDIEIHIMALTHTLSDDNVLLAKYPHSKIRSVTIYCDYFSKFISGIKFSYVDTKTDTVIEGTLVGRGKYDSWAYLLLSNNQYLVEVFGRKGAIIDKLGFKTNLGQVICIGGQGGAQFCYKLPDGYGMGAVCSSLRKYLNGIAFDVISIPRLNQQIRDQPTKEFLFFGNQRRFDYLIRYLSTREILKMSYLNKKIHNFVKNSEVFILKCLFSGDRVVLCYLYKLSRQQQPIRGLLSLHKWTQQQIQLQRQPLWKGQLYQSKLCGPFPSKGKYLYIVGVEFVNSNYHNTSINFKNQSNQIKDQKLTKYQESSPIFPFLTRKVAIWVDFDKSKNDELQKIIFEIKVLTDWYEAYTSEVVGIYAMRIDCPSMSTLQSPLQHYAENIWIGWIANPLSIFKSY